MLYSVYALWASGKDAVMGGMLVMGIGYIVYGFIAPRFVAAPACGRTVQPEREKERPCNTHCAARARTTRRADRAAAVPGAALPALAAGTLDKAKETGKLTLGYRADTRPFAYSRRRASRPASRSRCARRWPTR